MMKVNVLIGILLLMSGCGFGKNSQNAATHFAAKQKAIEEFTSFYSQHSSIDYVEFCDHNCVDLWILDKEEFDRKRSPAVFKFRLFNVPIDSPEVSNALDYASMPKDELVRLKEHTERAGCISIKKPFWDDSPVEVEVGYARVWMSKLIFRKFKDSVNVTNLVSLPPWRDDYIASLSGNWILVEGKPAFD